MFLKGVGLGRYKMCNIFLRCKEDSTVSYLQNYLLWLAGSKHSHLFNAVSYPGDLNGLWLVSSFAFLLMCLLSSTVV